MYYKLHLHHPSYINPKQMTVRCQHEADKTNNSTWPGLSVVDFVNTAHTYMNVLSQKIGQNECTRTVHTAH